MKSIGFIGIGIMGSSMASHLLKEGFDVTVYTRTKSKAEALLSEGAVWADSVAECVKDKDAVITIVGYPKDVEEVYFGVDGIIENAKDGAYLMDMTTTSPKLSLRIYEEAVKRGLHALDAPVTGGDVGAKAGTLTILVGGDQDDFDQCLPIFEAMGSKIIYQGDAGSGQHTKMCNQIAIAGTLAGACEAVAYAKKTGLDVNLVLDTISTGAAGSFQMSNIVNRTLQDDYAPGFFLKHFIKDMAIAEEEITDVSGELPVLEKVLEMSRELEAEGFGDLGTQALLKYYK